MIKTTKYFFFFLILNILSACSFDQKTGIWSGGKKEKKRIELLEQEQNQISKVIKLYSTDDIFLKKLNQSKIQF